MMTESLSRESTPHTDSYNLCWSTPETSCSLRAFETFYQHLARCLAGLVSHFLNQNIPIYPL